MVASSHSAALARRLPNARLTIYPDSGHGGVFQHHAEFVSAALAFLNGAEEKPRWRRHGPGLRPLLEPCGPAIPICRPQRNGPAGREVPVQRRPEGQHDRRPTGVPPRRRRPIQRRAPPRHADARPAPGHDLVVIASAGGSDTTPNWYKNLLAAGGADVQVGQTAGPSLLASSTTGPSATSAGRSPPPCIPGSTLTSASPTDKSPVAVLERRAG